MVDNNVVSFKNVLDTPYLMAMREWRNKDFVRNNMIDNTYITPETHERYIEKLKKDPTNKVFIVFYNEKPVAVMTFHYMDNLVESGSYIINEEDLGKGIGVITGYARFEYIFSHQKDVKMMTSILAHNKKNIYLQENFGCQYEETRKVQKADGSYEDIYIYTMTYDQWQNRKSTIEKLISRLIPIENIKLIKEM